jgi:hypothetical protein
VISRIGKVTDRPVTAVSQLGRVIPDRGARRVIPTLQGRIQTRIFVLVLIGSIVQLIFTPILPGIPDGAPLGDLYQITFVILGTTIVLGVIWEFIYHALMQFRWEKDWPTLFGLITIVNEGAVVWFVCKAGFLPGAPEAFWKDGLKFSTFAVDFALVWVFQFLFVNGPMRVPFLRWRHTGGRVFGPLPH